MSLCMQAEPGVDGGAGGTAAVSRVKAEPQQEETGMGPQVRLEDLRCFDCCQLSVCFVAVAWSPAPCLDSALCIHVRAPMDAAAHTRTH